MFLGYKLKENPAVGIILIINLFYFLLLELDGGSKNWLTLVAWGAKEGTLISRGEYWRLFSPIFMHIGFFHLISNTIGIIIFGPIMEKIFGTNRFIIIYLISGIWGNLFSFFSSYAVGAGASGALFGLAGLYAAYLYINRGNLGSSGRESLIGLAWIIGINLIFGFTMNGIDNSAHLGGLISGWIGGLILAPKIISIFSLEEDSMPVHIERRVLNQKSMMLWSIYIIVNICLIYLGAKIISSTFY